MTEEAALKYLASHTYNVTSALKETLTDPGILKQLIVKMNQHEEKMESIAFIGNLCEVNSKIDI